MSWRVEDLTDKQLERIAAAQDRDSWLADKRVKQAMPEADFQNVIVELATLRGWNWIWHDFDSRKNLAGKPDLELARVTTKQFFMAELKTGNNKPTPQQRQTIDTLRTCGVIVHVWTPADWHNIVRTLW